MLILTAGLVCSINTPDGVSLAESNEGSLTETSLESKIAEGGNVSNLNLDTNLSTQRWQGFVGNVTGNLSLGRSTNLLYNFGSAEIDTVFATTESGTFDWANLAAATVSEVDTQWSFSNGADQAVDAFTGTATLEGVAAVPTVTLGGGFLSAIFDDGAAVAAKTDLVFAANVTAAAAGFDGASYEYELMVPTTTSGTDTYYFYVSLLE